MDIVFLIVENILLKMDHKTVLYLNHFLSILKTITNNVVMTWKSKSLSDESIRPPATSGNRLKPKFWEEFNGSYLKTDSAGFNFKRINLYITYELRSWLCCIDNGSMLGNSLFGGVKLTSSPDPDKYSYSWNVILF